MNVLTPGCHAARDSAQAQVSSRRRRTKSESRRERVTERPPRRTPKRGRKPRRARVNRFAGFAAPAPPSRPTKRQLTFAIRSQHPGAPAQLQLEIESKSTRGTYLYAHWWFAWELLRRSRNQWEDLRRNVPVARGVLPEPRSRRSARRLGEYVNADGGLLRHYLLGTLVRFNPVYPKWVRLAPPLPDGTAPPGAREDEVRLREMFTPLLLPAVILGDVVADGLEWLPTHDYVRLFVHRDATVDELHEALTIVRARYEPWRSRRQAVWVARAEDIWGATFSPAEAIELLDGFVDGHELKPHVREIISRPKRNSETTFEAAVQAARRLRRALLEALRRNALVTLVGNA